MACQRDADAQRRVSLTATSTADDQEENEHDEKHHLPIVRPKTVGDCRGGIRPCPWVSCRFNLLLDVDKRGELILNVAASGDALRIRKNDSDEEFNAKADAAVDAWFDGVTHSCAIDVIEQRHGQTLEGVAELLCMTRERVRQLEDKATTHLAKEVKRELGDTILLLRTPL